MLLSGSGDRPLDFNVPGIGNAVCPECSRCACPELEMTLMIRGKARDDVRGIPIWNWAYSIIDMLT